MNRITIRPGSQDCVTFVLADDSEVDVGFTLDGHLQLRRTKGEGDIAISPLNWNSVYVRVVE